MDEMFAKSKTDGKLYHLGDDWFQRLRFVVILLDVYPKEDLIFLTENNLKENEYETAMWIPVVFKYLNIDLDKIKPMDIKEFRKLF